MQNMSNYFDIKTDYTPSKTTLVIKEWSGIGKKIKNTQMWYQNYYNEVVSELIDSEWFMLSS